MALVNKWKLWCETENDWVYCWLEAPEVIAVCPHDEAHAVDTDRSSVMETVGSSLVQLDPSENHTVEVQEVSPGKLAYRSFGMPRLSIAPGESEGEGVYVWPYDYYMLSIEYWGGEGSGAKLGDKITCEIDPKRNLTDFLSIYGQLQADAALAAEEIQVHPVALGAGLLEVGYFVRFVADTNPEYEIVAIDAETSLVTLDRPLENARTAGDAIYRTMTMGRSVPVMPATCPVVFGTAKIGASRIPAGWALRVHYEKVAGDTTDGREIDVLPEGGLLSV